MAGSPRRERCRCDEEPPGNPRRRRAPGGPARGRGGDDGRGRRGACVGKGTLFRRFGDRAGLLRALPDGSERTFQEGFIRGPAPLGPGGSAAERLVAFGHRLLAMIEIQGDLLAAAESGPRGQRLNHSVYAVYRLHVTTLLREIAPERDVDYMADALVATLAADLVLHQRRVRGLPLERLEDGWEELVSLIGG